MHKQTKQQKETLTYFTKYAKNWKYKLDIPTDNTITQRNNYVINIIKQNKNKIKNILDVGCGTGDLTCTIAKKGINITGIDFSKEMIKISKNNIKKYKCKTATFECCSIFNYNIKSNFYDFIFANGFIEYISLKEINQFLSLCSSGLQKYGSLVLSSRNRLFNIFSLNKFTKKEIKSKTIHSLLHESMILTNCKNINQLSKTDINTPFTKNTKLPYTGIDVSIRYQYTPIQLMRLLENKGFTIINISPIHIHGVPPIFKERYPVIHNHISNLLQGYSNNLSLIPFASSFMIHAKK